MRIRALALICSFSVILLTVLAGCGGGGGGEGGGSAPPGATSDTPPPTSSEDTSDATTRQTLQTTNLDVGPAGSSALGTLKRWSLPVPVKTNNDPRAAQAMDAIEKRLGTTIFDRTSIANTPDDSITRGLIISVGTGDPQTPLCGSATGWGGNTSEISERLFIGLDSATCTASLDSTIHQFGHTLGMARHFQNFGTGNTNGNPIGELFWRVLRTIYSNPIGTTTANIVLAP
jgi:hypothetical protein